MNHRSLNSKQSEIENKEIIHDDDDEDNFDDADQSKTSNQEE